MYHLFTCTFQQPSLVPRLFLLEQDYNAPSIYIYPRSVPPPPLATLASVQNAGGVYARDATISFAITPSLPVPVKHDLTVGGVWGPSARHRRARGGEMLQTLLVG